MIWLLDARKWMKKFYQRYDFYIKPIAKFILALIVFTTINKELGYDQRLTGILIVLLLSITSAFVPSTIMVLLAALVSILHVVSVSPILSLIVIFIMFILYFLFARYTPKYGLVILAVPILFALKIPFVIPLLIGLVYTPVGIIPAASGVVVYYMFKVIKVATTMKVDVSVDDTLQLYVYVIDSLLKNKEMILTILMFSIIILVVYLIRKIQCNYVHEIAILGGILTSLFGFLIITFNSDIPGKVPVIILGTIFSGVIVYIIHFFRLTLNYSGTEFVQFQDDEYYYYVKAVPKIKITEPEKRTKRIVEERYTGKNGRRPSELEDELEEKLEEELVEELGEKIVLELEEDREGKFGGSIYDSTNHKDEEI